MFKVKSVIFFTILISLVGDKVLLAANNQKLPDIPLRMIFEIGDVAIHKEGERVFGKKLEMFVPSESPGLEIDERPISTTLLDKDLFVEIWEKIKQFNFSLYENLEQKDFIEESEPQDARNVERFLLEVDGKRCFCLDLGARGFRDEALSSAYESLLNFVNSRVDVSNARAMQLLMPNIKMPIYLSYVFNSYILYANSKEIEIIRYCTISKADKEYLNERLALLEKATKANKEIRFDESTIRIKISEEELLDIWEEIKKIDFVRIINTTPKDFVFRRQEVLYSFELSVDEKRIGWNYLDRELKRQVATPLLKINTILDSMIDEKIAKFGKP